jgi:hypothetical protein
LNPQLQGPLAWQGQGEKAFKHQAAWMRSRDFLRNVVPWFLGWPIFDGNDEHSQMRWD